MEQYSAKKTCIRLGLGLTVMALVTLITQTIWFLGEEDPIGDSSTWMWLGTVIPLYLLAIPSFLLITRKMPVTEIPGEKLGTNRFWRLLPICALFLYGGNMIGTILAAVLSGGTAENALFTYINDSNPLKILVIVVLAPIIEEYVFRKQIIDRTVRYGEKTAVLLSGITFALFHQNLYQLFYAFGIGVVLGYIYVRTGRLRYSILLHVGFNFVGSVIAPAILQLSQSDLFLDPQSFPLAQQVMILPLSMLILAFSSCISGLMIAGIVMLCIHAKKTVWLEKEAQIPKKEVFRQVYWNWGMMSFVLLTAIITIVSLFYNI